MSGRNKDIIAAILVVLLMIANGSLRYWFMGTAPVDSDEMDDLARIYQCNNMAMNCAFDRPGYGTWKQRLNSVHNVLFNPDNRYNPPLHKLLLQLTLGFDHRIISGRMVFATIGILLIPLIYITGRKYAGRATGVAAAGLGAFNFELIAFSSIMRAYGIMAILCMCATWFFFEIIRNRRGYNWYLLFFALGMYFHYFSVVILAFQVGYIMMRQWEEFRRKMFFPLFLLSLPAAFYMFRGMRERNAEFPRGSLNEAVGNVVYIAESFGLDRIFYSLVWLSILIVIAVIFISPGIKERYFKNLTLLSLGAAMAFNLVFTTRFSYLTAVICLMMITFCGALFGGNARAVKFVSAVIYCLVLGCTILEMDFHHNRIIVEKNEMKRLFDSAVDTGVDRIHFFDPPDSMAFFDIALDDQTMIEMDLKKIFAIMFVEQDNENVGVFRPNPKKPNMVFTMAKSPVPSFPADPQAPYCVIAMLNGASEPTSDILKAKGCVILERAIKYGAYYCDPAKAGGAGDPPVLSLLLSN